MNAAEHVEKAQSYAADAEDAHRNGAHEWADRATSLGTLHAQIAIALHTTPLPAVVQYCEGCS